MTAREIPLVVSEYGEHDDPDIPVVQLQFDRLEVEELRDLMTVLTHMEHVHALTRTRAEEIKDWLNGQVLPRLGPRP